MRLGIRRKLIGTLILVGFFPLVISLVVILVGGAAIQLGRIRANYEEISTACAQRISSEIFMEVEKLMLVSRMPEVVEYVRSKSPPAVSTPTPTPQDLDLDRRWPDLTASDPELRTILENPAAQRLRLIGAVDLLPRQVLLTNSVGQLIAADGKTDDFYQADEEWWIHAFDGGKGRLYISTIRKSLTGGGGMDMRPGEEVVEIVVPIFDKETDGRQVLVGIIKDELAVTWLLAVLRDMPAELDALTQLIDVDARRTVYAVPPASGGGNVGRAESYFFKNQSELELPRRVHVYALSLLFRDLVMGCEAVKLEPADQARFASVHVPRWVVAVSKPSRETMTPVYRLAGTVAGIGIALILVLFVLGVAISNREVIIPILRLREATAAVGRGELNVRLLSGDGPKAADATFRGDELGELARDFDEMTRQLQKNVNQLERSNEAKLRFMELAGHELRTPVTYLLAVCQLLQKQLQHLSAAATDGGPEDEQSIALAAKNAHSVMGALSKVSDKTQRLSRIIENLLKLVNNDQFTTRLDKKQVDMRQLIHRVASEQRPFLSERRQQLVIDIAESIPVIEADPDKLEDAMTNLLGNAIRFSPDGGQVRIAAQPVIGDMLEILVEDSGPGIPAEDLANLFEPFYTGLDVLHHHSGTIEYGSKGLGLGLAIVRRFVELHDGIVRARVIVKDDRTVGTQFQILLPVMKGPPAAAGSPTAQNPPVVAPP